MFVVFFCIYQIVIWTVLKDTRTPKMECQNDGWIEFCLVFVLYRIIWICTYVQFTRQFIYSFVLLYAYLLWMLQMILYRIKSTCCRCRIKKFNSLNDSNWKSNCTMFFNNFYLYLFYLFNFVLTWFFCGTFEFGQYNARFISSLV